MEGWHFWFVGRRELLDTLLGTTYPAGFGRVLDVGCGTGANVCVLRSHARRVVGVDLLPEGLARARQQQCTDALFVRGTATRLPFACGVFDVVTVLDGGRVVFLEPNPYNPLFYIQILATSGMSWKGDGGIIRMRRSIIVGGLRQAGFLHPEMIRFGFLPPFAVNHPLGRGVEAVLERMPFWRWMFPFQLFRAHRP